MEMGIEAHRLPHLWCQSHLALFDALCLASMCGLFIHCIQGQRPRANSQYAMTVGAETSKDRQEIAPEALEVEVEVEVPSSQTWSWVKCASILITILVLIGGVALAVLMLFQGSKPEPVPWYRKDWAYAAHFSRLSIQMFNDSHADYVDLSPSFAMLQMDRGYNATVCVLLYSIITLLTEC